MRRWSFATLLFAAACSGDSGGTARPGVLDLKLTSAGASDGAIVVVISGGPVTSVSAAGDYEVASSVDASGTHVMIVGSLATGTLATLMVPDASRVAAYVVTVEQVADRNSFGLLDPARDQVSVSSVK